MTWCHRQAASVQGSQPRRPAIGSRVAAVTPGTPPDKPCNSEAAGVPGPWVITKITYG